MINLLYTQLTFNKLFWHEHLFYQQFKTFVVGSKKSILDQTIVVITIKIG